ncbi:MAG: S41 family peptidase [Alphaproteobacteria bacterium]|nr:S41 family peptidase [Alphaproteobacteria bacterium]
MSNKFYIIIIIILCNTIVGCKNKKNININTIISSNLIQDIINEVKENYVEIISNETLEINAINGIINSLDEYSRYITKEEFDFINKSTRGVFLGIGIEINKLKDGIEIKSVLKNSPASNIGLKKGDIIISIDNTNINHLSMKHIINILNNNSKLQYKLTILRDKANTIELVLKKDIIKLNSINTHIIDNILMLNISFFNEDTVRETIEQINKLRYKNIKGIIIDLRNNPGGCINDAIDFCDLFLCNKTITIIKHRKNNKSEIIQSNNNDITNDIPIVILINSQTASCAELVAAALADNKRAILIGEKTYGKGAIQSIIPIPGRGALQLTTAYFYSPNGKEINKNGVEPNINIIQSNDNDQMLIKSIEILTK